MPENDMSDHKIRIRQGCINDLDFIAASNIAMAKETEDLELDPNVAHAGVKNGLNDPSRSLYFIAEVEGQPVGQTMVTTEWSDWRNGTCWWIQSVYVRAPFRRLGVFRALYKHIRGLAQQREDVCGIRLYVHHTNERAISTYKRLGMTHTAYQVCEDMWPLRSTTSAGEL